MATGYLYPVAEDQRSDLGLNLDRGLSGRVSAKLSIGKHELVQPVDEVGGLLPHVSFLCTDSAA